MAFKFSVVMTAYNSENYLSVAIESIINQSLDFKRNIQIIIIDDASYDHTEFVNFLDSDDFITEYAFNQALDMFKKHDEIDIVSMPIYYFGARKGEHSLNYKYDKTQVINLEEHPEYIQLSGPSSFFRFAS